MALKYQRGAVVIVEQLLDKNGVNPKDRSVVLVRDFDDADQLAYGVAVTGTVSNPIPATAISLPYARTGKCKTGLTKPCVADCTWVVVAGAKDVIRKNGFVPSVVLTAILQQVQILSQPPRTG